ARGTARAVLGAHWRRRLEQGPGPLPQLARLVGSVPAAPRGDAELVHLIDRLIAARGGAPSSAPPPAWDAPDAGPLRFFRGCANDGLLGATSRRLLAALRHAGHTVTVPTGQDCCGALAAHTGRPGRAGTLQRRNREAFGVGGPAQGPLVVEAAGCGLELADTLPEACGPILDAAAALLAAPCPPRRPVPLRVAVHDPCHGRHGRGLGADLRALLGRIPDLVWCEPVEIEVCCGSGGAWGLRYPEMSATLARRKAADLAATGADLVVTTNPGCLGQIADGLALERPELPILPATDLWWYAVRSDVG
ncbi:hypothetical protein KDM41_09975, partial [bacterium]|nr:hypothetical protein [bacterium]